MFRFAIFGLVIGALAKWIMPGKDPGGIIVTSLIGIAGALIAGWVSTYVGFGGLEAYGFIMRSVISILGALLLLFAYRQFKGAGGGS